MNDEVRVTRGTGPGIIEFILARVEEIDGLAADTAPTFGDPNQPPAHEQEMRKFTIRECMVIRDRISKIALIGNAIGDTEDHHLAHDLYRLEATPWFDHPDYRPEWRIL